MKIRHSTGISITGGRDGKSNAPANSDGGRGSGRFSNSDRGRYSVRISNRDINSISPAKPVRGCEVHGHLRVVHGGR
jgi:hypothetical protein